MERFGTPLHNLLKYNGNARFCWQQYEFAVRELRQLLEKDRIAEGYSASDLRRFRVNRQNRCRELRAEFLEIYRWAQGVWREN